MAFISILQEFKLLGIICDYFTVGHQRFNAHTVKIVKCVVESKEISLPELKNFGVIDKVNGIMKNMMQNH